MARPAETDPRTDEVLMDSFKRGDARAFELLVRRHERGIYNFLLRRVRREARAEELLQEVFMKVIDARDRYAETAKFTTFLYTIARNLTVDESRRQKFRKHLSLDRERDHEDGKGSNMMSKLSDGAAGADTAVDDQRIRTRLLAALDTLPEEQREVFVLRHYSGLSFREIGELLDIPTNTVKSRMRYAFEKLRVELADLHADFTTIESSPSVGASAAPTT